MISFMVLKYVRLAEVRHNMTKYSHAQLKEKPEDELFAEYNKTKDISLRNELVNRFLYIAEIIAKKFSNRGIEYEDLYQVASLALIKALERYDINREMCIRDRGYGGPSGTRTPDQPVMSRLL